MKPIAKIILISERLNTLPITSGCLFLLLVWDITFAATRQEK